LILLFVSALFINRNLIHAIYCVFLLTFEYDSSLAETFPELFSVIVVRTSVSGFIEDEQEG